MFICSLIQMSRSMNIIRSLYRHYW